MSQAIVITGDAWAAELMAIALSRLLPNLRFAFEAESESVAGPVGTTPLLRDFHAALGLTEASFLVATGAEPALELSIGDRSLPFGEPGLGLFGERFWPVHAALAEAGRAGPADDYYLTVAAGRRGRMADVPADMRAMFDYGYNLSPEAYLAWLRPHGRVAQLSPGEPVLRLGVETPPGVILPLDRMAVQCMRIAGLLRSGRWDADLHRRQTLAELEATQDLAALLAGTDMTAGATARIKAFRDDGRVTGGGPFPMAMWMAALWRHAPRRAVTDLAAEAQSFERMAILIRQSVDTMPTVAEWRAAVQAG